MSIIDEKRRTDAAWLAEHSRAEQAPIPLHPAELPLRSRNISRTGSELAPGLIVTDDSQNYGYNNGFLPESPELVVEEDVPPAYSEFHDRLNIHQAGFDAGAALTGRSRFLFYYFSAHLANRTSW
jgi:hypothetical protein